MRWTYNILIESLFLSIPQCMEYELIHYWWNIVAQTRAHTQTHTFPGSLRGQTIVMLLLIIMHARSIERKWNMDFTRLSAVHLTN